MGAAPLAARALEKRLASLNFRMSRLGFEPEELKSIKDRLSDGGHKTGVVVFAIVSVAAIVVGTSSYWTSTRCLVPNNYLVWEATRPVSDCSHCSSVEGPVVLDGDVTRESFKKYAHTAGPTIVKGAALRWPAVKTLDFDILKGMYSRVEGAYEAAEAGCQFLNFDTDLFSLREVFAMSDERARHEDGQNAWYIGWGNCHPEVLAAMREHYSFPDFLPEDAEMPNSENVFFGYERGAVMHLDYIPRLMWQGQVRGNKTWSLAPIPECEHVCKPFEFNVEPGDIVLLDTRIWYHSTRIPDGHFSLTIQSEYG